MRVKRNSSPIKSKIFGHTLPEPFKLKESPTDKVGGQVEDGQRGI